MEFKTTYKFNETLIDTFLHRDRKGHSFLDKDKLEEIIKKQEKYKLFYFVRKSNYEILDDTPVLGAMAFKFLDSIIEGPFASYPKIKKTGQDDEYSEKIVKRFIPVNKVPNLFEKIELREYEINSIHFPRVGEVDESKIEKFWRDSLKILEDVSLNIKKGYYREGVRNYYGSTNEWGVHFHYSKLGRAYSPRMNIMVLGRENKTQKIFEKLSLDKLRDAFSFRVRDQCMDRSMSKGLAYNLSIKDVKSLFKFPENIIF